MATGYDERLTKLENLVTKTMDELNELRLQVEEIRPKANSKLSHDGSRFDSRYGRLESFLQNSIPELRADQTYIVINLQNRLDTIERRLRTGLLDDERKTEVIDIHAAVNSLIDPILDDENVLENLGNINRRILQIEEKLAA